MAKTKPKATTMKPPDAAALAKFVGGGAQPSQARDLGGATTVYTLKRGEKAGQALRRVTIYFPEDLHKRAAHAAVDAGVSLSELVVTTLAKALARK